MDIFWALDTCSKFHVVGALYHLFGRRWPFRNSHLSLSNKISLHAEFKVDLAEERWFRTLMASAAFMVISVLLLQNHARMADGTKSHMTSSKRRTVNAPPLLELETFRIMSCPKRFRFSDSHRLIELVTIRQKNRIDLVLTTRFIIL